MSNIFLVMAGGAVGSALRYLVGRLAFHLWGSGPWGTLVVNIVGGLAMGLLVGVLAARSEGGEVARVLIGVGLLGGFTTFSSFSLDAMLMLQRGETMAAIGYILLSVAGAIGALALGLLLVRSLTA